ncbi:MAG: porin, partial [Myxococcota bacterium]
DLTPDSDKEESPDPNEATTILPDSEAVDPTIEEEDESQPDEASASVPVSDGDDETHPDEATAILPDSEAVDDTIEEGEEAEKPVAKQEGPVAPSTPGPPSDPQWSIRWQNAFIVERVDDPRYQFLFGGRIQNDWGVYAPDSDLKKDPDSGQGTGTKFRRARLYFQGQFFRYGFFKAEYDFSNGNDGTAFTDVYAGLNLPKIGLLRVGNFKEPFSLQFQNSSNFTSFNERSGSGVFNPDRNSGIMLNGNFLIRDSTYAIAFMRRTDDVGEGFSNKEDYHLTARVTGLPYFEDGGARLLHLELGFSHQFSDKNIGTQYKQRPANDFAPDLVDTGPLFVDSVELFNAGLAVVEGSLSLQSEVTISLPHGGISEDPVFWGAYAELSWWITGETRRYLRGRGVFSRVVPKRRFDPEKGRWGALETALRYSWLDLSNDGIRGGTLSEWSFAINWVLFSNMRVSNNYILSHARDRAATVVDMVTQPAQSGIAHSWVTRFQIDF